MWPFLMFSAASSIFTSLTHPLFSVSPLTPVSECLYIYVLLFIYLIILIFPNLIDQS